MKRLFVLMIIAFGSLTVSAQNAKADGSGNYVAVSAAKAPAKNTGKTFTDTQGKKYPVYESARGKLYYMRTSKAGKEYKVYLKVD